VFWRKGEGFLRTTADFAVANQNDTVVLATYRGGIYLFASYGRTIIDGGQISSNTITAQQIMAGAIGSQQISANAISAEHIASGAIIADKIKARSITADHIQAGTITADEIRAKTIISDSIADHAITQMVIGQSPRSAKGGFSLSLDVKFGSVIIMASLNRGDLDVFCNDEYLCQVCVDSMPSPSMDPMDDNGVRAYKWGTLIYPHYPPLGWSTYRFEPVIRKKEYTYNASVIIINFKK